VVIFQPIAEAEVLVPIVRVDNAVAFIHIERLWECHEWSDEQMAKEIRRLAGSSTTTSRSG
jgi:hypothetical protein